MNKVLSLSTVLIMVAAGCGSELVGVSPENKPGAACDAATAIEIGVDALPVSLRGSTIGASDTLSLAACSSDDAPFPGDGAPETVYSVTATDAALYRFTLTTEAPFVGAVGLVEVCRSASDPDAETCVATTLDTGLDHIDVQLTPGETVALVVDGLQSPDGIDVGNFTLEVSCGCSDGERCTSSGVCRPAQAGDSCLDPLVLGADEPAVARDLATAIDGHATTGECGQLMAGAGAGLADEFFSFSAPVDGTYQVVVNNTGASVMGASLYQSCTDDAVADCVDAVQVAEGGQASMTVALVADALAFVVVDGLDGPASGYTIDVTTACVAECNGCGGEDGCGGSCGCPDGEVCGGSGVCGPPVQVAGDTCETARELPGTTLPVTTTGNLTSTSGLSSAFDALACPGVRTTGTHVRDEVWRFVAPAAGRYAIDVSADAPGADLMLTAWRGACQDLECVGYTDSGTRDGVSTERLEFDAAAGESVILVVDAWHESAAAAYELTLDLADACAPSCQQGACGDNGCGGVCGCSDTERCHHGACAAVVIGDACDAPIDLGVASSPLSATGSTAVGGDFLPLQDAAVCHGLVSGGSGHDAVYQVTAGDAGHYDISLTSTGDGADLMLYAIAGTGCSGGCLGYVDDHGPTSDPAVETVRVQAGVGEVFSVIVDAWTPAHGGNFELTITPVTCLDSCDQLACGQSDGCGGVCGCGPASLCVQSTCEDSTQVAGNHCGSAQLLTTPSSAAPAPVMVAGNLSVATLSSEVAAYLCPGGAGKGQHGADAFYRVMPAEDGIYEVSVAPSVAADLTLSVFTDTSCDAGTCTQLIDSHGATTTAETLELTLSAGASVIVAVDAATAADEVPFTLTVASACVPACDGLSCGGDDGCGGTCGCGVGALCHAGGCVAGNSVIGNSCDTPRELTGTLFPRTGAGDLTRLGDSHHALSCALGPASGAGAPDEAWSFVAPTTGSYTIRATPEPGGYLGDLVLAAWVGASCDGACAAHVDDAGLEGEETLVVDVDAGEQLTIVVDSWLAATADRYTLTVDTNCGGCTPGQCVPDACGQPCACAAGEVCSLGGLCQPASPGDTCGSAIQLSTATLPEYANGSIDASSPDALSQTLCGVQTAGGREDVWALPAASGALEIEVTPHNGADVSLYVLDNSCGACVAASPSSVPGAAKRLTVSGAPGSTHYIVVEAAIDDPTDVVTYDLIVDSGCLPVCGACGLGDGCGGVCACPDAGVCDLAAGSICLGADTVVGNTCANPLPLTPNGLMATGTGDLGLTTQRSDAHSASSCHPDGSGGSGRDEVWTFTAPQDGDYTVSVTPTAAADLMIAAYMGSDCGTASCLGAADAVFFAADAEQLPLNGLSAGALISIVVDSFGPTLGGSYDISVAPACTPSCSAGCGGDDGCGSLCGCSGAELCDAPSSTCGAADLATGNSCANPRTLSAGSVASSSLSAAVFVDDQHSAGACAPSGGLDGAGAPDEVWRFVAPTTAFYRFTATPEPGVDVMLYGFEDDTCLTASCVGATDTGGAGQVEALTVLIQAGDAIQLVVDAWSSSAAGPYTLSVEAP